MTKIGSVLSLTAFLLAVSFLLPQAALAHDGDTAIRFGSYLGGLTHPVLGFGHFLALISVGILAGQNGGRAIWIVALTFVGVMAVGGLVGIIIGLNAEIMELGIALSVIILGGMILAGGKRVPFWLVIGAVGFFGLVHGYAHGVELPIVANPVLYAAGVLTSTAAIYMLGVVIGDIPQHYDVGKVLLRVGGGVIGALGILTLVGVV